MSASNSEELNINLLQKTEIKIWIIKPNKKTGLFSINNKI
jgi:hypothetical protein